MIQIKEEILQELLDNFYVLASFCDDLNIYEHEKWDDSLQKKKKWVDRKFGRKINKETYD